MQDFLLEYPLLAPLAFVVIRMAPILIPPIPGIAFDLLGIAVFGWKLGLILALVSAHLASVIAFYVARYNRDFVLTHVAPLRRIQKFEDLYSEKQVFWMLVAVRFVTSPMFDYVNYVAGLSKMSLGKYLLSTSIGIFPYAFCVYYFGGKILETNWLYGVLAFVGVAILLVIFQQKLLSTIFGISPSSEKRKPD